MRIGSSESVRKKQLGQYFTDQRVGRLLASLGDVSSAKSIIDPMVGSGNLLQACLSLGAAPDQLVGVELDPLAYASASSALQGTENLNLILGDAFEITLPKPQFDLVITNPPYIRYQSKAKIEGVSVPTSAGVRSGLIRAIKSRAGLSEADKTSLLRAARKYPGTSDIAVPAWILSASLVKEGGVLAIIVPQTWMSRNYAQAVRDLLDEMFSIEVIVEDGDVSWFPEAQVRTQLVLARKQARMTSDKTSKTVIARASKDLIVNNAYQGDLGSENAVAHALRNVSSRRPEIVTPGLVAHVEHDAAFLSLGKMLEIPTRVAAALNVGIDEVPVRTLDSYGWKTGQGLRTGANDFFYVSVTNGVISPAPRWKISSLPIPSDCLLPTIRRQSDLGDGYAVDSNQLTSHILSFKGWVTKSDLAKLGTTDVRVLPAPVGRWINHVAESPLSPNAPTKLFPHLSAVATNSKFDRNGRPVNFWYQLPDLAPRHRPILIMGRVIGGQPKTVLNRMNAVVDANFSGLWPISSEAMPVTAMLALLNSSWTWASLESMCTVLGGGALKVEATDLKKLVVPNLSANAIQRLAELGNDLLDGLTGHTFDSIDEVISDSLQLTLPSCDLTNALRSVAEASLRQRSLPSVSSRTGRER